MPIRDRLHVAAAPLHDLRVAWTAEALALLKLGALSVAVLVFPIAAVNFEPAPAQNIVGVMIVSSLLVGWSTIVLQFLRARRATWSATWRWHKTVFRYRSTFHKRILLRFAPGTLAEVRAAQIIANAEAALEELVQWHGFSLRGIVCVYVFPAVKDIQAIFGDNYAGLAWCEPRAIVVPATRPADGTIRHELSHLFTAKWNASGLPLLNEGLATWWERGDSSTDAWANYFLRLQIRDLLDPQHFYDGKSLHAAYCLAASFTSFLIRRFGKQCYRDFYRRATQQNFESCFYNCFGMTFAEADALWRMEIATTQLLRRRLAKSLSY